MFYVDHVETVPPKKTDQLKAELEQYLNVCVFVVFVIKTDCAYVAVLKRMKRSSTLKLYAEF